MPTHTHRLKEKNGPIGLKGAYGENIDGHSLYTHESNFTFKHGGVIPSLHVAYETWGQLNDDRSNAILVHTGLSASAHARSNQVGGTTTLTTITLSQPSHPHNPHTPITPSQPSHPQPSHTHTLTHSTGQPWPWLVGEVYWTWQNTRHGQILHYLFKQSGWLLWHQRP